MDASDVIEVAAAALRSGAAWEGRATPALIEVLHSLREAISENVSNSEGLPERSRLRARLHDASDVDLREILLRAYAVLMLTDPQGMAAGRYTVAGSTIKHTQLHVASSATAPIPPPVKTDDYTSRAHPDPSATLAQLEQAAAENERLLGSDHSGTLTARSELGLAYASVGRTNEAIRLLRQVLGDRERLMGVNHPDTAAARSNFVLAESLIHTETFRISLQNPDEPR